MKRQWSKRVPDHTLPLRPPSFGPVTDELLVRRWSVRCGRTLQEVKRAQKLLWGVWFREHQIPEIATAQRHTGVLVLPCSSIICLIGYVSIVCQIFIQDDTQQREKKCPSAEITSVFINWFMCFHLCIIECYYMASRNNQAGKYIIRALAGSTVRWLWQKSLGHSFKLHMLQHKMLLSSTTECILELLIIQR